jgi:tetratricopeptide (TPR) repeat protein
MLETVREYAADRLSAAGEAGELRRRHALHYLGQAEAAAEHLPGRDQVAWLRRLDVEQANVRAAIQWTIETAHAEAALRFAAAMWRYWQLGGHGSEGLATVESLVAIPGLEETPFRLGALEALGGLLYWRGLTKRAIEVYEEQLRLARVLGDQRVEADALFNLASSIGQVGDAPASLRMLEEAGHLYQILNDRRGQARVASLGGITTMIAGDAATGYKIMSDVLPQHRESDDVFYEALTLGALSWGKFALGEFVEVLAYWREAIQITHALGDVASSTFAMEFTAVFAAEAGLWEDAATMRGAFEALTHAYALLPPRSIADLLSRASYVERIAAALGPDRYEEALARGHRMSLDDAVEYAMAMSFRAEAAFTR